MDTEIITNEEMQLVSLVKEAAPETWEAFKRLLEIYRDMNIQAQQMVQPFGSGSISPTDHTPRGTVDLDFKALATEMRGEAPELKGS